MSDADVKLDIGREATRGLVQAPTPTSAAAAEDHADEVEEVLKGADMVFVTAGEGGGTGTGGAPVVARIARSLGALTIGVVTRPFGFEGKKRSTQAETGSTSSRRGRHADRDPQRPAAADEQREHDQRPRCVQAGGHRAAAGRCRHHRPDHHAGAHQRRLRRREGGHEQRRFGADGHRFRPW